MMRKYEPLGFFLKDLAKNEFKCTFKDVEIIIGSQLPKSARTHKVWWANHSTHSQAVYGWLCVGWKIRYVDIKNEIVEFSTIKKVRTSTKQQNY
jgi:hypothetical protein